MSRDIGLKDQKLITHPGDAHFDEFMACCYLLTRMPDAIIERRDNTEYDLLSLDHWVIDQGGRAQPEWNNFDHHQLERDSEPICALSLVLMKYGDYNTWTAIFPWMEMAEVLDSKGPKYVADFFGIDTGSVIALCSSPLAGYLLKKFSRVKTLKPDHDFHETMLAIGNSIVEQVRELMPE